MSKENKGKTHRRNSLPRKSPLSLLILGSVSLIAIIVFAAEGDWTAKANFPHSAQGTSCTSDGTKIWCAGGYDGSLMNEINRYDITGNSWDANYSWGFSAMAQRGIARINDKIYMVGGISTWSPPAYVGYTDVFNTTDNQYYTAPDWNESAASIACTSDLVENMYCFGGEGATGFHSTTARRYSTTNNTWYPLPDIPTEGRGYACSVMAGDKIFLIGGYNGSMTGTVNYVNQFNTTDEQWYPAMNLPTAKSSPACSVSSDNSTIYVTAGTTDPGYMIENSTFKYNISADNWETMATNITTGRADSGYAYDGSNLYVIGGNADGMGTDTNAVEAMAMLGGGGQGGGSSVTNSSAIGSWVGLYNGKDNMNPDASSIDENATKMWQASIGGGEMRSNPSYGNGVIAQMIDSNFTIINSTTGAVLYTYPTNGISGCGGACTIDNTNTPTFANGVFWVIINETVSGFELAGFNETAEIKYANSVTGTSLLSNIVVNASHGYYLDSSNKIQSFLLSDASDAAQSATGVTECAGSSNLITDGTKIYAASGSGICAWLMSDLTIAYEYDSSPIELDQGLPFIALNGNQYYITINSTSGPPGYGKSLVKANSTDGSNVSTWSCPDVSEPYYHIQQLASNSTHLAVACNSYRRTDSNVDIDKGAYLYVLDDTLTPVWNVSYPYNAGDYAMYTNLVSDNTTLYFFSQPENKSYAYSWNGTQKWNLTITPTEAKTETGNGQFGMMLNQTYFIATSDDSTSTPATAYDLIRITGSTIASAPPAGNTAPTIDWIQAIGSIDPIAGTAKEILFQVNLTDADGYADITNVAAIFTKTSETSRENVSCSLDSSSGNLATFNCTITMQYYDGAGTWNIKVNVTDTTNPVVENTTETFTYNELLAMDLGANSLNFGSGAPGSFDLYTTDGLQLQNKGNVLISKFQVKGQNLTGQSQAGFNVPAASFKTAHSVISNCDDAGTWLIEDTFVDIPASSAGKNENNWAFFCERPPNVVPQTYQTGTLWVIQAVQ